MKEGAVIALLLVLIIAGAGAGYFVGNDSRQTSTLVSSVITTATTTTTATSTSPTTFTVGFSTTATSAKATTTTTSTRTVWSGGTTTATTTVESLCGNASSTMPYPSDNRSFVGDVNYSGSWEATTIVLNKSASPSPVFVGCYHGVGNGYFMYQSNYLSNLSLAFTTAQKADDGAGILRLIVNGNMNTTKIPYGVTSVTSLVDVACYFAEPGPCPYMIGADGYATPPGPVWGNQNAYLFDCANSTITHHCVQTVTSSLSPYPSYVIDIEYPFTNSSSPTWANCYWSVSYPYPEQADYARCTPVTSDLLVVGQPPLPAPV